MPICRRNLENGMTNYGVIQAAMRRELDNERNRPFTLMIILIEYSTNKTGVLKKCRKK
jgi:hypothetical protein